MDMEKNRTRATRLPAFCLTVVCAVSVAGSPRQERQHAVETGLLPAIVFSDHTLPTATLVAQMKRYRVPGVSIALIDGGRIAWAEGYGTITAGGLRRISTRTLFQAASISKLVTAVGVLKLVQDGKLQLDANVNAELRNWTVPAESAAAGRPVTLRELLSHRAGANVEGFPGYTQGDALPSLRQILNGAPPANSPPIRITELPGSGVRYSGGGYEIVQQLAEDATGATFGDAMDSAVLHPAGMNSSAFTMPLPARLIASAAHGHGFDGAPVRGGWNNYPELAAAGLWATPSDLARLGISLSQAYAGQHNQVLSPPTARLMLTRTDDHMGLGPGVYGDGKQLFFDHAGWTRGFRTYIAVYPLLGQGIIVMTNGDGGDDLISEIVRSAARVYGWPDFKPEQRAMAALGPAVLNQHAGVYHAKEYDLDVTVRHDGDHLTVSTPRGSYYTFYPATSNDFFAIEDGSTLSFSGRDTLHIWSMTAERVRRDSHMQRQ
jgi:CubicO group peptidase (beta-lactamase class C family)